MLAQRWGWIRLALGNIQTANSCKSLRNRPPLPCSAPALLLLCFAFALLCSATIIQKELFFGAENNHLLSSFANHCIADKQL